MKKFRFAGICFLLGLPALVATSSPADEFLATIRKVENGTVTFVARNPAGKKAKGKGARKGVAGALTLPVVSDVRVTTAVHTRRTGEFHVGTPVGGGLANGKVRNLPSGTLARLVTDGKQVIEMNIVFDDGDGTTIVAVPPRPAPKK